MTDARAALRDVRILLLDMDGTLYLGGRPIPGAADFLRACEARGIRTALLTNNSSRDPRAYEEKLERLGLPFRPGSVTTSGSLAALELGRRDPPPTVLLLGTPALERQMREAGVRLLPPEEVGERPDVVLLGFDMTLTYARLRAASHWLLRDVEFVATHPDLVCPTEEGPIPDTGSMIALLEAATGRRPDRVLGKPSRALVDLVLEAEGVPHAAAAFVGDRLYTDMRVARNAGITGVLVLSGETRREDVDACPESDRPTLVVDSVADLIDALPDTK